MNLTTNSAIQAVATMTSALVVAHYKTADAAIISLGVQGMLQLAVSAYAQHYNTDGTNQRTAYIKEQGKLDLR